MSTEQQTVDPELVEQTKQQIRHLVREIAQISKSDIAPAQYYDALLNRVVSALAAVGGAVWTLEQGRLDLQYQINLRQTGLADSQQDQQRHGRLLQQVLQSGEGMLVAPHSGTGDDEEAANSTPFLLLLGPLKSDQEVQGIVEVFQRPDTALSVQQGYLRFLMQMCDLAGDYLKTRRLRHFTDRQTLWAQLEQFTRLVHRGLDPRSTAYTIANEGRRLVECDRVSVGICRQHKCRIEAVSGQDTFDKRSNVVSLLGKLATAVTATGEAIWYTGDTSRMAPQVEEAVQAYIDESHSKVVGVIPLRRPVEESTTGEQKEEDPGEVIGALIVEQIEDSRPHEGLLPRVEIIGLHASTALSNALEYHQIFLLPLWLALGRASWVLKARTLPKTMAIASAVGVLLLWLLVWPATFNLEGKGTLEPASKRDVFAGLDGVVADLPVEHGQFVKKGEVLAKLRNPDLEASVIEMRGKLMSTAEQLRGARSAENKPKQGEDAHKIQSEIARLKEEGESYKKQLAILEKKREQLVVTSPIDGQINTWQLREMLLHRPVRQGQVLMSVADPNGDWELEIHMPEDRMGHVALAQKNMGPNLPVRFILQTSPGLEHEGELKEVHAHAEVRPEEGNTVLLRVKFSKDQLNPTDMTQGATVTAKVNCGRVPIGYKYFHDVIAFIQSKILFKL
ncbi:MAG TPA: HlyD family efflux transporter periplasmic adaptor subunit [Pirellulales bacterium]|jgi:multidrug efflux pump subunit AcrA (membrane-fusion protein)|nr:HlyD family efflux transporter periplasmic adaptor subunit [Pirellulales bacterium]